MSTPKLSKPDALKLISPFNRQEQVVILGIRGYFKDSMGVKDVNDIGIYDDAIFLITPNYFGSFNGNTDPSVFRNGIATLKAPQVVMYEQGIHGVSHAPADIVSRMRTTRTNNPAYPRTYWAFRQASNVTVTRVGSTKEFIDSPAARFYTDLHCGGQWTTSSEGCQTVIKDQWPEFVKQGYAAMDQYKQKQVPYILINQP